MSPQAITAYAVFLFLALVALAKWKDRHDAAKRMKRGLGSYVSAAHDAPPGIPGPGGQH